MRPHSGVWTRTEALSLKLSRWLGPSTNKEVEGKSDLQWFGPVAVPNCCGPVIHSSIGPGHALPRWLPGLRIYLWISKLNMVTYLVFASYVRPKRNWPDVLREGIGVFAANFCLSLTDRTGADGSEPIPLGINAAADRTHAVSSAAPRVLSNVSALVTPLSLLGAITWLQRGEVAAASAPRTGPRGMAGLSASKVSLLLSLFT